MIELNNIWIDFNCPKCGYTIHVQLVDAKSESIVFCHNCKANIQMKDDNASAHKGINDINKAFEELNKTLKNLGK